MTLRKDGGKVRVALWQKKENGRSPGQDFFREVK